MIAVRGFAWSGPNYSSECDSVLPPLSRSFSVSEAPAKPSLRPIWNSPLARPMLLNKAGIRCDPKKRIPMNARIASSVTPSVPAMDIKRGPYISNPSQLTGLNPQRMGARRQSPIHLATQGPTVPRCCRRQLS